MQDTTRVLCFLKYVADASRSKWVLPWLVVSLIAFNVSAQNIDRNITVKIKPLANCNVYLASYFGMGKIFADTAWLNQFSEGAFKGKKKLTPGMYFVVSPKNAILFELLLDSAQKFSITADTAKLPEVKIFGSAENVLFSQYQAAVSVKVKEMAQINHLLPQTSLPAYKTALQLKLAVLSKSVKASRDSLIKAAPHSQTALFLNAAIVPELPPGTVIKTRADSINASVYLKRNFWNDVPFNDDRLLYTPFFEAKIDDFFRYYVQPAADSVIKELQYMLLYARTGKEMYPYLLMKFTNRYFNPDRVGQNKVFLYLFNEFFMKGDTVLLNPVSKKMIFDRAYALMANQVGDPTPPLNLTSADGKEVSLYSLKAPYTLVVFWDPSCTHCQKELPRIDSIYRSKWKAMGVKLYSVNMNAALNKDVAGFAQSKNLSADWIHTYQTEVQAKAIAMSGKLNYYQLYDVAETPTLYLLDAEKRILAKRLNFEQMDALMKVKNLKR